MGGVLRRQASSAGTLDARKQSGVAMDIFERARNVCATVTKNLIANKNGGPFAIPVDYVALGIPHYPDIIKKPMDLGTVQKRLTSGQYTNVDEWIKDVRLVF